LQPVGLKGLGEMSDYSTLLRTQTSNGEKLSIIHYQLKTTKKGNHSGSP
jgi:hypothetical protein